MRASSSRSFGPRAIAAAFALSAALGAREGAADPASIRADEHALVALRVRFSDGQMLENAGRWSDALDSFRPIARQKPTPEVVFHVALCLDHLGRLRQARATYRAARSLSIGRPAGDLVASEATERLADLETRLPKITLAITGERRGVRLVIDGDRVVDTGSLRVDPGPHVVVATRGGLVVAAVAFSAQERHSKWITLNVLTPTSTAQASRGMPIERATPSR